jgi:hypothetical protein
VLASTTVEVAALDSVRLVGLGSASHCGGGHDSSGRCSRLCLLRRRDLSQQMWWGAGQVRAQL